MHDDLLIPILVAILASHAEAQRYAAPLNGQIPAGQHRNEIACPQQARSQSRYDRPHPTVVVPISSGPATGGGSRAKAERAGDVALRMRNRQEADAQNSAVSLHTAGLRGSYSRARKTCLDGRGDNAN
jgi:hypothetical protein